MLRFLKALAFFSAMDKAVIKKWREKEKKLVKQMPRYKAHDTIGQEYGVSRSTVAYWLEPSYRIRIRSPEATIRNRNRTRKYYHLHKKEQKEIRKISRKRYRSKPELHEYLKSYDLRYKRLVRHLDNFVLASFSNNNCSFSSNDISDAVKKKSGICLNIDTIEKILDRANGSSEKSIMKVEKHIYKISYKK